jgi:hypothetical protein
MRSVLSRRLGEAGPAAPSRKWTGGGREMQSFDTRLPLISVAKNFDRLGLRHPRESGDLDSCSRRNDEE